MENFESCIPDILLNAIKDFFIADPNRTNIIVHAMNAKKNILFVKLPHYPPCSLCNKELIIKTNICNYNCKCCIHVGHCDICGTNCEVVFVDSNLCVI